jgi:hypothetical protein
MKTFRMPDGSITNSLEDFMAAWEAIYRPLEEFLNVRVSGFDPDFLIVDRERPNGSGHTLPMWLARRIVFGGSGIQFPVKMVLDGEPYLIPDQEALEESCWIDITDRRGGFGEYVDATGRQIAFRVSPYVPFEGGGSA